ncbi:hypothetical protein [Streptacidiphilus sp. MAP5-3]|uniref:hypothetical protein n=1 Tax=unclassified Streptacidiphilus TaxID=2643834 RepID=UPI0035137F01
MSSDFSRRSLLRWTGVGIAAAAATPLLAACGSSGSSGSVSNAGKKLAAWPTYVPSAAVRYDLPALPNNGAPGVLHYPALPLKPSVTGTPGDGSTVTALTFSYGAPVKLDSSNQLLAAVGKALGVDFKPNFVVDNGTSFAAAQTTMQASGNLPDLIGGTNSLPAAFIEAECADLTPYLSGDAIKDYPNLASIPTRGWELAGRIGGKILTVPIYRYNAPLQGYLANRTRFQAAGAWGTNLSPDQFLAAAQSMTGSGRSVLGTPGSVPFGYPFHVGAAGAPRNWQLQGGTFTHMFDTPEFQQGLETMQNFYAKGLYSLDALTATGAEGTAKLLGQTWDSVFTGLGGISTTFAQVNGAFDVDILNPYGSNPKVWGGDVVFNGVTIKKSSPARIKMLLRILDFLAAPFGSKEWELLNYGIEGVHFTRGADGSPSLPTALGQVENVTNVPFKYLAQQPQPLFQPGAPQIAQSIYNAYKTQLPIVVADPSVPYQSGSATYGAEINGFTQAGNSAVADVVSGKQSLKSWTGTVAQLKSQFKIDQMATEFAQGYTAAQKS